MSVKHALLALLSAGQASTYQLRKDFEASTGSTWPLNIGQVATTLARLERDGLVVRHDATPAGPADGAATGSEGRTTGARREGAGSDVAAWALTEAGRAELDRWWSAPVPRQHPGRDELMIKLALATTAPGVDIANLIQRQRQAGQAALHEITRARRAAAEDLAATLVLDHHVYALEAELRWLDDIEGRLARARHQAATSRGAGADTLTARPAPSARPPAAGRAATPATTMGSPA